MKPLTKKAEIAATFKYAGAFIAWLIGSGFATGQEILQFFSSYGIKSIAALALNLIGFAAIGIILILNGFDNKNNVSFDHYGYYCGNAVGKIYYMAVPATLIMIISILFSGSGAVFEQYFSFNRYISSAVMAAAVLAVYLIGFEKMVKIVSLISPFVIIFTVFVGGYSLIRDIGNIKTVSEAGRQIASFQAAPHWSISAFLYISLNFLSGSIYYTELGRSAVSRRSAKYGAIIGAVVLMITVSVMSFAILLNADAISKVEVPTLYLANRISGVFGSVFLAVLVLGMFSTCSTTVWSFCSRYYRHDKKKNAIISVGVVAGCLALGFVPFGKLVSVLYPLIGYMGLYFIGAVFIKPILNKIKNRRNSREKQ